MIAETLAGIALVKSAVEGIKSAINTANNISDIASHIDNLFEGEKQLQKKRANKASVGIKDQFGIKFVAQEMIDAKLAQEQIQEMKTLIDLRFGHGTWQGIIDERAKRIREAKEAAAQARREAIKKQNELIENIRNGVIVVGVIVVSIFLFIIIARQI